MEGSILTSSFAKTDTVTKNKEHKTRSFHPLGIFVWWKETGQTQDWLGQVEDSHCQVVGLIPLDVSASESPWRELTSPAPLLLA